MHRTDSESAAQNLSVWQGKMPNGRGMSFTAKRHRQKVRLWTNANRDAALKKKAENKLQQQIAQNQSTGTTDAVGQNLGENLSNAGMNCPKKWMHMNI